jgi:hypothetical protein
MKWINVKDKFPKEFQDVLVCDNERQWVASYFKNMWIASHPDYKRNIENEDGFPYLVFSIPTYWMPLPNFPLSQ